jgi:trigger factor
VQTSLERLDGDRVRLRVEVPADDIDHAFEHALRDLGKNAKIPGFRPGKVPATVLRARLGNEAIVAEALDGHLGSWYGRALDIERIEPVDRPDIDYAGPPEAGQPWSFTAEVAVAPTATLPDPLTLEAPRRELPIPDGAIDERIERMRDLAAQLEPVADGAAEVGLTALIDFQATVAGKKLKNASATDYLVELGSGRLLDGLEDAIVGMRAGETREATTTLPAEAEKKLAGREAVFSITLKELKRRILPDLDDAFAQEVSEFDTLAALKDDVAGQLRKRADEAIEGEYRAAVLAALGEVATVDVPLAMVERRLKERLEGVARGFARRGVRLEQYLAATGQTIEDVVVGLRPDAEASARQELALKALAVRLDHTIDDAELEAFVLRQATEEGEQDPSETTRKVLESPAARESLREELRLKKALDHAVEVCKPVPFTEAPEVEGTGAAADESAEAGSGIWLPGDPR